MTKDWTSSGSAGALVSPPRRFKLETPIRSWNVAVLPSGSVGSLAWKLQTTRAVSAWKNHAYMHVFNLDIVANSRGCRRFDHLQLINHNHSI